MLVLFKYNGRYEAEEYSVNDVLCLLSMEDRDIGRAAFGDYDLLEKHIHDPLLPLYLQSDNPAIKKLVGTWFSNIVAHTMSNDSLMADQFGITSLRGIQGIQGYTGKEKCVQFLITSNVILGAKEPEKLTNFAIDLHRSAKLHAANLLASVGALNKRIDEQMLASTTDQMEVASQAFAILANIPRADMEQVYLEDDINCNFVNCWPDQDNLNEILEYPENYAIAQVNIKS